MGKNKVIAIIPARWASTRLPGKPLADINGKSMIQLVYEAVEKSEVDKVVVATDNELIFEAVKDFGGDVVMTSPKHQTGTDRILEAYENYKEDYEYVVNVQGDEPMINPDDVNRLVNNLKKEKYKIATLVGYLEGDQRTDRNTVKAFADNGEIVMFTRSPLYGNALFFFRHIGVYGFSKVIAKKIDKNVMIETTNEIVESLEQIRWADNGIKFTYAITHGRYKGIDTEKDLDHYRSYLNKTR
jgi:3-deoxy-manno-octulosonate cytidylyltransferase (CMP-KDO synthetase)